MVTPDRFNEGLAVVKTTPGPEYAELFNGTAIVDCPELSAIDRIYDRLATHKAGVDFIIRGPVGSLSIAAAEVMVEQVDLGTDESTIENIFGQIAIYTRQRHSTSPRVSKVMDLREGKNYPGFIQIAQSGDNKSLWIPVYEQIASSPINLCMQMNSTIKNYRERAKDRFPEEDYKHWSDIGTKILEQIMSGRRDFLVDTP